jgi:hypothetical protein
LADYKDRLAREDYTKKKSKPIELDDEAISLKADLQRIKRKFSKDQYDAEMAARSPWRKVLGGAGETYHAARELMTSGDLSAVLRQGGFIVLGHPVRAVQAGREMFRAMKSQEALDRINQRILERPNAKSGLYDRAKLHLADQNGKLSAREEAFMSSWGKKIPGVAMSERAYVTFLNRLRADSFDAMIEAFKKDREPTLEEARAIANYINVATGRGFLGENSGVALNYLFFSPRYVVSRFQMLGGQPLYGGSAKTRVMIAKEYGRFLAGVGVVYALAMAAGGIVGTDPSKSDFGKIQFGKTRVDPLSGLSQVTVLLWNQGKGVSKSFEPLSTGIPRKKPKYGEKTEASSLGRFLRQKLAPWPAAYVNLATGEDVVGRTVTPQDVALGMVTPISIGDIYRALEEQGVPAGTAFALLSLLGMGVQTYDPRANRK